MEKIGQTCPAIGDAQTSGFRFNTEPLRTVWEFSECRGFVWFVFGCDVYGQLEQSVMYNGPSVMCGCDVYGQLEQSVMYKRSQRHVWL